jgi:hypothetical protein
VKGGRREPPARPVEPERHRPLPRDSAAERHTGDREFEHKGRRWIARLAGTGLAGTGSCALGLIDAVHFHAADDSGRPLREALLPRGRFGLLFDTELADLLEGATPIVIPGER